VSIPVEDATPSRRHSIASGLGRSIHRARGRYLTLIGSVDVLHRLYDTVIVPRQVISELIDPAAPEEVRNWASDLPNWIDVRYQSLGTMR
jgi:hypothetical protein